MGIEIRHAIPDDAGAIHRLTSNYQARVRGGKRAEQAAGMASVDQLRHRIERSASKMQRMVALGDRARLLAVLQAGSWNTDRENEFASTRWRRFLNGLKAEWPDHWGLYSLAVQDGLTHSHPAVRSLVAESRVFALKPGESLYAPLAIASGGIALDPSYQTLLAQNGMRPTDRTGMATVPGLISSPYYARLMEKHRSY